MVRRGFLAIVGSLPFFRLLPKETWQIVAIDKAVMSSDGQIRLHSTWKSSCGRTVTRMLGPIE